MSIDRESAVPLHIQIQEHLRVRIESGEFAVGTTIPTEAALASEYGVNRLTVRQAIADLRAVGVLVARQGRGTFVAEPATPFDVTMDARNLRVEHERARRSSELSGRSIVERVLEVDLVMASPEAATEIGPGPATRIRTLSTSEGAPLLRTEYWVRSPLPPEDIRARGEEPGGIGPAAWNEIAGAEMFYGWRSFDARPASRADAEVLGVPVGSALLERCGLNTDEAGRPVMFLRRLAPGGRMRIVIPYPRD